MTIRHRSAVPLPRRALLLLGLAPFYCGTAARAADPPAAPSAPTEAAEPAKVGAEAPATADANAEPRTRVTAFALSHPNVEEARMVEIMRSLEAGLKKNPRLEMKELDTRLADFANETPADQIEAARTLAREGNQALLELRIPEAVQRLDEAVSGLAKVLPYIKKQELADAMAALAVAQFEGGDKKSGVDEFSELVTFRPDYVYDPQKLPPKYAKEFEEAQHLVEKAKRQPIAIATTPDGAQAYVDGKYLGLTPCSTEPLPLGKHFVTIKKEGYRKAVLPVLVQKKVDARADIALDRSEKYLLVEQARAKVEQSMGADLVDAEADTLKSVLFLDQAVFVKAAPGTGNKIAVDAFLYDLRTRRRLAKLHEEVPSDGVEVAVAPLAQTLYAGVNYEGEIAAPAEEKVPERAAQKPIYKTWWLWTAVGAGAVVAGGAVGVYFAVKAAQPPMCPDTVSCLQFGP